jgi:hypothetical protein
MPHPEVLGLDAGSLTRSADAHAGYARVLRERGDEAVRPWMASSLVFAAVYRSLVDPAPARREFTQAASAYLEMGMPLAGALAVCAGDDTLVARFLDGMADRDVMGGDPIERVTATLARRWAGVEVDARGLDRSGMHAALRLVYSPAGRTGLPLAAYGRAFDEVQSVAERGWKRGRGGRSLPYLVDLLQRAAEPVHAAMADTYHWRRLHSAVLPVEPEIVGACRCILRIWKGSGRTLRELYARIAEDAPDEVAVLPLEVAADLDEPEPEGNISPLPAPIEPDMPRGIVAPGRLLKGPLDQTRKQLMDGEPDDDEEERDYGYGIIA